MASQAQIRYRDTNEVLKTLEERIRVTEVRERGRGGCIIFLGFAPPLILMYGDSVTARVRAEGKKKARKLKKRLLSAVRKVLPVSLNFTRGRFSGTAFIITLTLILFAQMVLNHALEGREYY